MIKTVKQGDKIKFYWENGSYMGYVYKEIDGFYTYVIEDKGGTIDAYVLRALANKIDKLNKPWNDQINEYFKNEQAKEKILKEGI